MELCVKLAFLASIWTFSILVVGLTPSQFFIDNIFFRTRNIISELLLIFPFLDKIRIIWSSPYLLVISNWIFPDFRVFKIWFLHHPELE